MARPLLQPLLHPFQGRSLRRYRVDEHAAPIDKTNDTHRIHRQDLRRQPAQPTQQIIKLELSDANAAKRPTAHASPSNTTTPPPFAITPVGKQPS
ncbi:hypothetical protein [Nakamurella alba]|uniref:hypothetical protein n=1 Tax=Nakamurella alba TaxID=2665158 RepID=UPI001E3FF4B8|nr:hypothetical protein [Nakamurella alba]